MVPTCRHFILLLGVLPLPLAAQSRADSIRIKELAIAAIGTGGTYILQPGQVAPKMLFDPTVLRTWYDTMLHRGGPVPAPPRDTAEIAALVKALGAPAAVKASDLTCDPDRRWICTVAGLPTDVSYTATAIGEPRITGDSATIVVNRRPIETVGRDEAIGGRAGSVHAAWLRRTDGTWTLVCRALIQTDVLHTWNMVRNDCESDAKRRGTTTGGRAGVGGVLGQPGRPRLP